jgi:hypothetical protein
LPRGLRCPPMWEDTLFAAKRLPAVPGPTTALAPFPPAMTVWAFRKDGRVTIAAIGGRRGVILIVVISNGGWRPIWRGRNGVTGRWPICGRRISVPHGRRIGGRRRIALRRRYVGRRRWLIGRRRLAVAGRRLIKIGGASLRNQRTGERNERRAGNKQGTHG